MLNYSIYCLTLLATLIAAAPKPATAEEPFTVGSFKSSCALAGKTHRIVLVDFYTTWCGPCKKLDETTWKNKTVRAWLTKTTVSLKIDAEKQTVLATKYKINAYPTILLLKPDGTEIDRLVGYSEPTAFLAEAKLALTGQDSIARAKAKLKGNGKEDPSERMNYGRALAQKGRYAEALKEYLWCLDEGNKHSVGFYGVRMSFLLSDIKQLGAEYPAAIAALKQRRDAARVAIENGSTNIDVAADFAAFNENLDQNADTLIVYDRIKSKNAQAASVMFRTISGLLLEQKRYSDLLEGSGNVSAQVERELETFKQICASAHLDKEATQYFKEKTVTTIAGYYEALLGTEKTAEADALRDKLLKFDPSMNTYSELIQRAVRSGKPEAAKNLKEAARTNLSAADFSKLEISIPDHQ